MIQTFHGLFMPGKSEPVPPMHVLAFALLFVFAHFVRKLIFQIRYVYKIMLKL